ncbi:MAG: DegT/DnrJ/EryC1/StrS aminotransferase family protein [Coxiellaceae bacterium]|nr:DegT/DnrJ/EryC1/StrS aminotransferase family protein [Coxiellaceae bacterium]
MVENEWPYFEEDEIQAVEKILRSGKVNYWTGQEGRKFEKEFASYHQCEYGIAVANGSVALELALYAFGIGPGDEVIVTPKTFVATASSVVMRGAIPVFADVDLLTQNITAESIEAVITPKTKAVICVHLGGWPCKMDKIMALAEKHNLYVIEDCAQAHGAEYKGKKVGSWGHINAFSFCQDKIMTTGGEGGMVTTNDKAIWEKAWAFKDHGKCYDTVYIKQHPPGFRWLHEDFGTNWRMTEMQAAIGRCQLKKLDQWLSTRRFIADQLNAAFKQFEQLLLPEVPEGVLHSYYKYYLVIKPEYSSCGVNRDKLMRSINDAGIKCVVGSCSEIYLEKCFEKNHTRPAKRLDNARCLTDHTFVLSVHHNITKDQINDWIVKLSAIFSRHFNNLVITT